MIEKGQDIVKKRQLGAPRRTDDFDELIRQRQALKNRQDRIYESKKLTNREMEERWHKIQPKIEDLDRRIRDADPYYKKKDLGSDFPEWRDDRIQPGQDRTARRKKMERSKKTARQKREEFNNWLDRRNKAMRDVPAEERDRWAEDYEKRDPKPLGMLGQVVDERRNPIITAVVFGAAAAIGSGAISLIFEWASRRRLTHHLQTDHATYDALPEAVRAACLYPAACSILVQ